MSPRRQPLPSRWTSSSWRGMSNDTIALLVGVNASLKAGDILCAMPGTHELPFLMQHGYSNEVNVNASSIYGNQNKTFRTSVQAARTHNHLVDEEGELNFPMSARYLNPVVMGWMVNESNLATADLSNYTTMQYQSEGKWTDKF